MKKILSILFVLALVLSFSLVATTPVAAYDVVEGQSIQNAINAAAPGATITVGPGTYQEQVIINKDLTLEGVGDPVIKAPTTPMGYTIPEIGATFEPVVFAFGGTLDGTAVSGAGQIDVSISGFVVDGDGRSPGDRAAGIFLRNVVGTVSDNTVDNFFLGKQTFGIIVYGDSDVEITYNTVGGFGRGGIGVLGDLGALPKPNAIISYNEVTAPPDTTWAANGIQMGWGATGMITGNEVVGSIWPGETWAATGILVPGSSGVEVSQNTVHGNEIGIGVVAYDDLWGAPRPAENNTVEGNDVYGNDYGIVVQGPPHGTIISDNDVYGNYCGVAIWQYYGTPTATDVTYNSIYNNDHGVMMWVADASEIVVNFNSIEGNAGYGVYNGDAGVTDATLNWWGDASGPSGQGQGTGDAVSMYADFMPWLMEEDGTDTTETDTGSGEDASASTPNVSATATGGDTDTTVTVGEYVGNPTGVSPGFRSGAVYIDVHVGGTLPTQLVVEVACPGTCSGVVLQWWDGDGWESVDAPTSVVNGKIQFVLSATSSPTIEDLWGTPFGLGSLSTVGWEGSSVNKAAVMAPWIALLATMMAGATLLVVRRRRAQI